MQLSKTWLASLAWEDVITKNESICQAKSVVSKPNKAFETSRQKWESARSRSMTLLDAIELCRACSDLRPFVFNCTNTFAQIARDLIDPWATQFNNVEAELFRRSVTHYVDGQIQRRELLDVLKFMEKCPVSKKQTVAPAAPPVLPPVQHQRQLA